MVLLELQSDCINIDAIFLTTRKRYLFDKVLDLIDARNRVRRKL